MRRCPLDVRAWRLQPPLGVVADQFVLESLDPQHDAQDHEAWSSSIEHIDDAGFPDGRWPRVMTLDENRADLERHARDFAARSGFTSTVIGPSDRRDRLRLHLSRPDGVHDAVVASWVCATHAGRDAALRAVVFPLACRRVAIRADLLRRAGAAARPPEADATAV